MSKDKKHLAFKTFNAIGVVGNNSFLCINIIISIDLDFLKK